MVYFPKASQFDRNRRPEQREFWALCKATGWELVSNRYQMQVFANPAKNPTPIETDPVVQVENVHAAMKAGAARSNWLHAVLCAASDLGAIPKCGNNSGSAVIRNLPSGRFALG